MPDKRMLRQLDYLAIATVFLIIIYGLIIVSSATHVTQADRLDPYGKVLRQTISVVLGVGLGGLMLRFDYGSLTAYANWFYLANIVMLAVVEVQGKIAMGAQKWLQIGSLVVQPSEIAKVFIIISFATFLNKRQADLKSFGTLVKCFIYMGLPIILVLIEPDLGTALVFLAIMFGMLFVGGARPKHLLGVIGLGGLVVFIAVYAHLKYGVKIPLADYQIKRLTIFLDPYSDPTGSGYHVIQSLIAIGSGGAWGKGLYHGMQNQLNFLPEQHTDFIFSVLGEELGFIGTTGLLSLFLLLFYRLLRIARKARDNFGTLLVTGFASMMAFHVIVNVGMTISMMPITGIPLPFFSYGGSAMISNLLALGIALNVYMRRETILF